MLVKVSCERGFQGPAWWEPHSIHPCHDAEACCCALVLYQRAALYAEILTRPSDACPARTFLNHSGYSIDIEGYLLYPSMSMAEAGIVILYSPYSKMLLAQAVLTRPAVTHGISPHGSACCRYPLFMVAPEATTKSAACLLKFSSGAFAAQRPVLPVLLHYRAKCFHPGWGSITSTLFHMLRMLSQFSNSLEVGH